MRDRYEIIRELSTDLVRQIDVEARDVGASLKDDLSDVITFTSERLDHLLLVVGQPGFEDTLIVERDIIALYAMQDVYERAEDIDDRILSVVRAGLSLAARGAFMLLAA